MKSVLSAFILILISAISPSLAMAQTSVVSKSKVKALSSSMKQQQSLGGVSDGGSTGIYVGARLVLLDLYALNPQVEKNNGSRLIVQNGTVVVKDQPAFQVALRLLAKSLLPQPVQALIADALVQMKFTVSDEEFSVKRAVLPEWLAGRVSAHRLKTIAMYTTDEWGGGAAVFPRYWNDLGELSQAGVLIHEALRHIQFVDENSQMTHQLSDVVLQDLTAQIVLQVPALSKSAELGWSLKMATNNRFEKSQEIVAGICDTLRIRFSKIASEMKEVCERPLPTDESDRERILQQFAVSLTSVLPDVLSKETNLGMKEFMRARDAAVLLSFDYSRMIHIKSAYEFIRIKASEQRSISDGSN